VLLAADAGGVIEALPVTGVPVEFIAEEVALLDEVALPDGAPLPPDGVVLPDWHEGWVLTFTF